MQTLLNQVADFIKREALFQKQDRLVVGVSGGLDAIVLLQLLKKLEYRVELAHMNYGLRGAESERDENFVRELAKYLQLPFHLRKIDPAVFESDGNLQEIARTLRYDWFEELVTTDKPVRQGQPVSYIVTAHHANDQAETILMNLFRGAGLNGVKGMQPKRGKICRPLLFAERASLEAYAAEEGLKWVEDSSNLTDKYSRNRIRQQVLPVISELYPDSIRRIYQNSRNLQHLAEYTGQQVQLSLKKLIEQKGSEQWLPILKWKKTTGGRYLLYEWLQEFGFTSVQLEQAILLMESQTGQVLYSPTHQLLKNRNWLILSRQEPATNEWRVLETTTGVIDFPDGILSWSQEAWKGNSIPTDPMVALIDSSRLEYPLLLRKWKAGDYFYPLGMAKKKKLARFLIDEKIPRHAKEKIWVLESGNSICWVLGLRLDDRFKIRPGTQHVSLFRLQGGVSSGT